MSKCKYCGAEIQWSKDGEKSIPLNADLSRHRCQNQKQGPTVTAANQQATLSTQPTALIQSLTSAEWEQRQKDIQKSHAENMAASKEQTAAVLALTGELSRLNEFLEVIIKQQMRFIPATEVEAAK